MTVRHLLIASVVCATWLIACRPGYPQNSESQLATEALRLRCQRFGVKDPSIPVVRAVVEREGPTGGKFASGIRYEVLLAGRVVPGLTFGSVGIDSSLQRARSNATEDWTELFADQYCAARGGIPGGTVVGMRLFYPSGMGIRGNYPGGPFADRDGWNRLILKAVAPSLPLGHHDEIGLIDLKMVVQPKRGISGECRVNGSTRGDVCDRLAVLPWPKGDYMYKQVFTYRSV
jgi:hypothetical protein